jgi:hypothetical protein
LVVNLFDVRAFNVGPLDARPVSVPLGVNLFDVRTFNVGPLDVRPVSDPLPRRPLGCKPLECMSVVHLQTKSLSVSGRQRAEGAHAKKVYAARAYAEGTAYSRGAGSFINSIVAVKRCPRVVCPKAGQFGQVLVSAKLYLRWCCTFADLGAFYPFFVVGAPLASSHGTLKDGFQSSYAISTKNGSRHKKNAGTRMALAPEKC